MTGRSEAAPRHRLSPATVRRLLLLIMLVLWELLPRFELVPKVIMAPLSATLYAAFTDFWIFASALWATLVAIMLALLIAYVGGGFCGLILAAVRPLRQILLPILASLNAIPLIVTYPILTAWMGIGPKSQIWFAGIYGFLPMLLSTAAGASLVSTNHINAVRSMGASRSQIMREVIVPSILPAIAAGLRLSGSLVAVGVVAAEMLTSTSGIGFLITANRTMFKTPQVYLGILLVLVLAGLLDRAIGIFEQRTSRWMGGGMSKS